MNPPTADDLATVRRLIHAHAHPDTQHDWLEALGLAPYEAPGYNPESTTRNGTATRTRTVVRSGL